MYVSKIRYIQCNFDPINIFSAYLGDVSLCAYSTYRYSSVLLLHCQDSHDKILIYNNINIINYTCINIIPSPSLIFRAIPRRDKRRKVVSDQSQTHHPCTKEIRFPFDSRDQAFGSRKVLAAPRSSRVSPDSAPRLPSFAMVTLAVTPLLPIYSMLFAPYFLSFPFLPFPFLSFQFITFNFIHPSTR